jgi:hypothetical protein
MHACPGNVKITAKTYLQVYLQSVAARVHEVNCRQAACCLIELNEIVYAMLSIQPVDQPAFDAKL